MHYYVYMSIVCMLYLSPSNPPSSYNSLSPRQGTVNCSLQPCFHVAEFCITFIFVGMHMGHPLKQVHMHNVLLPSARMRSELTLGAHAQRGLL